MYALYRIITMILAQFSFSVLPGHAKSVCYGNVLRILPGECSVDGRTENEN